VLPPGTVGLALVEVPPTPQAAHATTTPQTSSPRADATVASMVRRTASLLLE
jgi:hypothetical protein